MRSKPVLDQQENGSTTARASAPPSHPQIQPLVQTPLQIILPRQLGPLRPIDNTALGHCQV